MKFFTILVFLLINIVIPLRCYPVQNSNKHVSATAEQLKFMQKFGYLNEDSEDFGAQYSDDTIQKAVLNIQKFGGIEQTGIMDEKTIELMTKKRCGVKDIIPNTKRSKRYAVMATGWKKREITFVIANWSPKIGEEAVAREIEKALNIWGAYGNLTFTRVNHADADIKIVFGVGPHGDPFAFDGPGNILAHAFFPYVSFGGDVHFDGDENWTVTKQEDDVATTDFFSVAIHELGHALGLGHSEVRTSIMFPYYRGYDSTIQLDYDDIRAMYLLYIKSPIEMDDKINPNFDKTTEKTRPTEPVTESSSHSVTYEGDFETVEVHKKHQTNSTGPPDICEGVYDAVAVIRQELYVFRDEYVWRFKSRGEIEEGYPIKIHQFFHNLPRSISKIDGVYEKLDGTIALFSGSNYWTYDDRLTGPLPLTDYGLPGNSDGVNAAFIWTKNDLTYLYKKNIFWRFNETSNRLDNGYPKTMHRWRGIPNDIDAVITWTDGSTYFFKGSLYWRFDDNYIRADEHYPLPAPQYWFGCPDLHSYEPFMRLRKKH